MPLIIGMMALRFPAGLSIYWVTSNLIGLLQYALLGRVDVVNRLLGRKPASDRSRRSGRKQIKKK